MTKKPCPYCKAPLPVSKGKTFWCGRKDFLFRWDGKRFRRTRKPRGAA